MRSHHRFCYSEDVPKRSHEVAINDDKGEMLAEEKKWAKQNFRATHNIGLYYYLMTDFDKALKFYLEAYKIKCPAGPGINKKKREKLYFLSFFITVELLRVSKYVI